MKTTYRASWVVAVFAIVALVIVLALPREEADPAEAEKALHEHGGVAISGDSGMGARS